MEDSGAGSKSRLKGCWRSGRVRGWLGEEVKLRTSWEWGGRKSLAPDRSLASRVASRTSRTKEACLGPRLSGRSTYWSSQPSRGMDKGSSPRRLSTLSKKRAGEGREGGSWLGSPWGRSTQASCIPWTLPITLGAQPLNSFLSTREFHPLARAKQMPLAFDLGTWQCSSFSEEVWSLP